MSKEGEYGNAISFRDRERSPQGSSKVLLILSPPPWLSRSDTSLEQWCDSGGVFAHSHASPQVKPLLSPHGPALPPGADLLVTMMGGVSRDTIWICAAVKMCPCVTRGSPTLDLLCPRLHPPPLPPISFFLHPQTSSLCLIHLAAFLGRLHTLQSAGPQLGSGSGSLASDPEKTRAGSGKSQSAAVINAQLV